MDKLRKYFNRKRNYFRLPDDADISISLQSPWRISRTSRCRYHVYSPLVQGQEIIVQDDTSLYGIRCGQNPYEPAFHSLVEDILPLKRGSFNLDHRTFYWSERMKGLSLHALFGDQERDNAWKIVHDFSDRIRNLQEKNAFHSSNYLSEWIPLCMEKIGNPSLTSHFMKFSYQIRSILKGPAICSWSHGDLWPGDVFYEDGIFRLIDWEWAVNSAPLGSDLIDFYVTAAEHIIGQSSEKAWLSLLCDGISQLKTVRKNIFDPWIAAGLSKGQITQYILYALLRHAGRVTAQDGYFGFPILDMYMALASRLILNGIGFQMDDSVRIDGTGELESYPIAYDSGQTDSKKPEQVKVSIIIPTLNRHKELALAVESIVSQNYDPDHYEIIVVDNGSSIATLRQVEALINRYRTHHICYVYEPAAGMSNARHRGAFESKGEILIFTDDDIIAFPGWLGAIMDAFKAGGMDTAMVGGKVLPLYEAPCPEWIDHFSETNELGTWSTYLSLVDLGNEEKAIPANFVFGCNYAIRKKFLYGCRGFHPDNLPIHLMRYQGDGEYGLSKKIMNAGFKTIYHPRASVAHLVTRNRMTPDYFCLRSFKQGIEDSYTEIRHKGHVADIKQRPEEERSETDRIATGLLNGSLHFSANSLEEIRYLVTFCYQQGRMFHRDQICIDPALAQYVLREDYLNINDFQTNISLNKYQGGNAVDVGHNLKPDNIRQEQSIQLAFKGQQLLKMGIPLIALSLFDQAAELNPTMQELHYLQKLCLRQLDEDLNVDTTSATERVLL